MSSNTSVPLFLVSNGQGGLTPNIAGSAMIMALAEDLTNTPIKAPVPDHKMLADRQARVDRYFSSNNETSTYETGKFVLDLPKLASPQPLHHSFLATKPITVASLRKSQASQLDETFVGTYLPKIHEVVDKAIAKSKVIESEILQNRSTTKNFFSSASLLVGGKAKGLTPQEKGRLMYPIEKCLLDLNAWMKSVNYPLRIVWRDVITAKNEWSVDMWLIYADTPGQAEIGSRTWFGSTDIFNPADPLNKSDSRLKIYSP